MGGKYSLTYWLFHAITFKRKVLTKIHELKIEKSLNESRTYFTWNVETNDVDARVVTDTHNIQMYKVDTRQVL